MKAFSVALWAASAVQTVSGYWMEDIEHRGRSAYNPDPDYQVFRNVKEFGAKGDGVTDDTAAINLAISSGNRCGPQECKGNTVTPAVVYFPPGTYMISGSIIDYFYTQIIGDPTNLPVIKATADFPTETTLGLIDGNRYGADGLGWKAVNVFFRQIRNLILDTTNIPAEKNAVGLHWPSAQATAVSNVVFRLSYQPGTQHVGMFMEEGSGGLLNDLVFYGGLIGAKLGNQQYTSRNWTFYNSKTAIHQIWNWGWTYKSINIIDCDVGIDMPDTETASITLIDSYFARIKTAAIRTARDPPNSQPPAAGSLIMENVIFDKVPNVLVSPDHTILVGSATQAARVKGYAMGNVYDPEGPKLYQGNNPEYFPVPRALLSVSGHKYYERSKPHYSEYPASCFISVREFGGVGDGVTDDTTALNQLFTHVAQNPDLVAYVDAGTYLVTNTISIPAGAKIVGEGLASIIMGSGVVFSDMNSPRPVVRVGAEGETGRIEWSDMIISTRGACPGATLIEYNLASSGDPSGMWDVHTRIGGFAGTDLQLEQCAKTPDEVNPVKPECIAAFMSMHITPSASGLYSENCWLWVADHDLEDAEYRQISIFAGRGLLVESKLGRIWLSASGSEHHVLYQYQLLNTQNIYMGQIQTESPYFQPNPPAMLPFPPVSAIFDPDFVEDCQNVSLPGNPPCEMAWGLRVLGSRDIVVFGAGLYSFFNNYSTNCSDKGAGAVCQARIFDLRDLDYKRKVSGVEAYNLNTVGTVAMITRQLRDVALYSDNMAGFVQTINLYKH